MLPGGLVSFYLSLTASGLGALDPTGHLPTALSTLNGALANLNALGIFVSIN